ncbi:hypothetical protein D3C75_1330820 [compost metagenome]
MEGTENEQACLPEQWIGVAQETGEVHPVPDTQALCLSGQCFAQGAVAGDHQVRQRLALQAKSA